MVKDWGQKIWSLGDATCVPTIVYVLWMWGQKVPLLDYSSLLLVWGPPPFHFFCYLVQPENISVWCCNVDESLLRFIQIFRLKKPVTGFTWHQFTRVCVRLADIRMTLRQRPEQRVQAAPEWPSPRSQLGNPKGTGHQSFPIPGGPQLWFPVKYLESSQSRRNIASRGPFMNRKGIPWSTVGAPTT